MEKKVPIVVLKKALESAELIRTLFAIFTHVQRRKQRVALGTSCCKKQGSQPGPWGERADFLCSWPWFLSVFERDHEP